MRHKLSEGKETAEKILEKHLGHATGLLQNAPTIAAMEEYAQSAIRELQAEIERLRAALTGVIECTGSSTLQQRIAREALNPEA